MTTDDAYVGAQKVLITPDISGKIDKVVVKEGQHVKQGDELFEIDPVPFRLAVDQAKAAARPEPGRAMTISSPTSRSTARCSTWRSRASS